MTNQFVIGDSVENKPVATVDGIVYKVEGDTVWLCLDEHLARRFAASDKMFVVCQVLIKLENAADDYGEMDWDLLTEATALAREVVEMVTE